MWVLSEYPHVSLKESKAGGECDIKWQCTENEKLHLQHILLGVRSICDENEIFQLGWIYLFIFAGDEQRRDAYQLQLGLAAELGGQVAVDDANCYEECLLL